MTPMRLVPTLRPALTALVATAALTCLAGCAAEVGDPAELEVEELLARGPTDIVAPPSAMCWWDPQPQRLCPTPGRQPTCPECGICLDCSRKDYGLWGQWAQIRVDPDALWFSPAQLADHVVIGIGNASAPTDYEYRTIDPDEVVGGKALVNVPARFAGAPNVYVWFVRDFTDAQVSYPIAGGAIPLVP